MSRQLSASLVLRFVSAIVFIAATACGSSSPGVPRGEGLVDGLANEAGPLDGGQLDGVGGRDGSGDGLGDDGATGDGLMVADGEVFDPNCVACHGSQNPAPPRAFFGRTATNTRGVGAHQTHLGPSTWHVQFYCADCHRVPKKVLDPGHIDTPLPAELTFSARAGTKPVWNQTTCAGVYCHGATLSGGKVAAPIWTKVDGSQKKCDSCHGFPPTKATHPNSTSCAGCHGQVVNAAGKIKAPLLHINGKLEVTSGHAAGWAAKAKHGATFNSGTKTCSGAACHGGATLTGGAAPSCQKCHPGWEKDCTFCHGGTDNQTGAPPETVDGKTAASVPGVGRHSKHVMSGTKARYDCTICHVKPKDAFAAGHIDPRPGDVKFSGLGTGTKYNYKTYMCTNIYCHGNGNGQNGSAPWVGTWSNTCASCHPSTPTSGRHTKHVVKKNLPCSDCHGCVVNVAKKIVNTTLHVNGQKNYCGPTGFNATTKRCTLSCHGENHKNKSW